MADSYTPDQQGLPPGYVLKPQYELAPREVARRLREKPGSLVILDCRLAPEFDAARINGSIHIPLHELEQRLDEIELPPGSELAVICHHGVRSLKAALLLQASGYPHAKSIAGGIDLWSMDIDRSIPRYERNGSIVHILP